MLDYLDHVVVGVSVHLPLEQPLGVHELAVHLPHASHHVGKHHSHHGLLVQVLITWPLLECGLETKSLVSKEVQKIAFV